MSTIIQPIILEASIGSRTDGVTDDTDLCVLPLTHDSVLNPFRVRGFHPEKSQLLLRSILALSFQHQANIGTSQTFEALEHRSRASELLAGTLQNGQLTKKDDCVLASILILITLDVCVAQIVISSEQLTLCSARYQRPGIGPSTLAKLYQCWKLGVGWPPWKARELGRRLACSFGKWVHGYEQLLLT